MQNRSRFVERNYFIILRKYKTKNNFKIFLYGTFDFYIKYKSQIVIKNYKIIKNFMTSH